MDIPERNSIRLERTEKDIDEIKKDMKSKVDKDDLGRIENMIDTLLPKTQFDQSKTDIISKIDETKKDFETDIEKLWEDISKKVSLTEYQPVKWIFGTIMTIFSGFILTQVAVWLFNGGS